MSICLYNLQSNFEAGREEEEQEGFGTYEVE